MQQADVIMQAYDLLQTKENLSAISLIEIYYPMIKDFSKGKPLLKEAERLGFNIKPILIEGTSKSLFARKSFTEIEKDRIFLSDFYQCRYSGLKLFAPPVLTIMSLYLENAFPCFKVPNFPLIKNHQGMYTYYPSPDHVTPLFAGGSNDTSNLVTSSSTLNMVKGQYTNKEMGWKIINVKNLDSNWDGGRAWFLFLMQNKNEVDILVSKSIELKTFHNKINPLLYFKKWENAFKHNNDRSDKKISNLVLKKLSLKENLIKEVNKKTGNKLYSIINQDNIKDLKSLPVGTIAYNKATRNKYVLLKKETDGLKYFSESEGFTVTIKTKPLLVEVEFKPELNVFSIVELPINLYTLQQLKFIKEACRVWSKGDYYKLVPNKIEENSVFTYLLKSFNK